MATTGEVAVPFFPPESRVRLTKNIFWKPSSGTPRVLTMPKDTTGIAGKMQFETGFVFVHFDKIPGEPCLFVPVAGLTQEEPNGQEIQETKQCAADVADAG